MRRLSITLLTIAGLAALPSHADAAGATGFRCAAIPVTGTVLGQALPVPSTGTVDKDCVAGSIAPTLDLPAPLSALLSVQAVNGITTVDENGVYAGAGLANLKIGSVPIPLPPIPIPANLTKIPVSLPAVGPLPPVQVAEVDLTPAINALASLPSKNLLDAGVLYSQGIGSCTDGTPTLAGQSRVANASILGLPVDASNTVDSAINLVDTTSIALSTLNLSLAKVTILGGVVNVNTAQVLDLLTPIVAALPPIEIPAQVGRIKLTASSQTTSGDALVQRALRAEVTLAGQSIADLAIGTIVVGGGVCEQATPIAPDVPATAPAPAVALACTTRKLALIDVLRQGDHVRLFGAADKSLAGKVVSIVFQATGKVVAQVRVGKDGGFTTTAPLPRASIRNSNRARYIAKAGGEKSLNLKLARRMVVTSIDAKGDTVTIKGKVIRPLAKPVAPIVLKRRVTCKTLETIKTFKPDQNGSFSVTVKKPANLAAAIYRLQTRVRRTASSTKTSPTFTLPRAVDL